MPSKQQKDAKTPGKKQKPLPRPGSRKRDPKELEEILSDAIESSMPTSDAIAVVIPDVKVRPDETGDSAEEKKK